MTVYSKLFASILDSSVWLEPMPTRIVWLTLLAAKDQDGFARFASVENLARRAVVSEAEAAAAVKVLEAPDRKSSNPDHGGRRIERVHGGWMVLNAKLYDDMVRRADELTMNRDRVRRFRAKKSGQPESAASPRPSKANAGLPAYDALFEEAWAVYPKRPNNAKASAWRQWLARVAEGVDPVDMLAGTKGYSTYCTAAATESQFIKQASTFYGRDRHFASDFTVTPALPRRTNGKQTTAEQMTAAMKNVFRGPKT